MTLKPQYFCHFEMLVAFEQALLKVAFVCVQSTNSDRIFVYFTDLLLLLILVNL